MPLLSTFSAYSQPTNLCVSLKPGHFSIVHYDNRELHVTIGSGVTGDHCFILGSVTPPECQMFSFLLLAHTLNKEGATRITGIIPYLAYSRGQMRYGQLTCTVNKTEGCSLCPWRPFFPALFRESLGRLGLNGASFVSPDQRAIPRCQAMMSAAGVKSKNLVYFEKHRTESGIVHHLPVGKDTGTTLISASEKQLAAGAEELISA